jgi:UDP:flavonoid glycosyltransferase YjiC (YdhE family)
MKAEIEEMEINSKIKNVRELYRGINDFKKGYQPRTNIVKDEQCDLVVDSHSILARWRKYFSQTLNVHGVKDVRQAEIHSAELLVLEPSVSEFELAIEKIKSHKSPGIDQTQAEQFKAGGRTISLKIHKLIISICNKEELTEREERKE